MVAAAPKKSSSTCDVAQPAAGSWSSASGSTTRQLMPISSPLLAP